MHEASVVISEVSVPEAVSPVDIRLPQDLPLVGTENDLQRVTPPSEPLAHFNFQNDQPENTPENVASLTETADILISHLEDVRALQAPQNEIVEAYRLAHFSILDIVGTQGYHTDATLNRLDALNLAVSQPLEVAAYQRASNRYMQHFHQYRQAASRLMDPDEVQDALAEATTALAHAEKCYANGQAAIDDVAADEYRLDVPLNALEKPAGNLYAPFIITRDTPKTPRQEVEVAIRSLDNVVIEPATPVEHRDELPSLDAYYDFPEIVDAEYFINRKQRFRGHITKLIQKFGKVAAFSQDLEPADSQASTQQLGSGNQLIIIKPRPLKPYAKPFAALFTETLTDAYTNDAGEWVEESYRRLRWGRILAPLALGVAVLEGISIANYPSSDSAPQPPSINRPAVNQQQPPALHNGSLPVSSETTTHLQPTDTTIYPR